MITIIAMVIRVFMALVMPSATDVVIIPPMPQYSPVVSEDSEWAEYHAEAVKEYADEFTALFDSYEIKRAKNGAMMIRKGNSGSYKFCKKG